MKYGFVLPWGDARTAADMAQTAERAGWDGLFVWEPVWGVDAWVSLAAAAMVTSRIRLGTMLTPLARLKPWTLAGQTATLDNLSGGRVILSVGLGAVHEGWTAFGEVSDRKARAELLDEGLDILTGLWAGQPFRYEGKHYHVRETSFLPPPPPVQRPRIPIWVVGAWPHAKSMRRALRYDGLIPSVIDPETGARQATATELAEIQRYAADERAQTTPFDFVVEGETPGDDGEAAAAILRPWVEAGATWWIEAMWGSMGQPDGAQAVWRRLEQGPPSPGG